MNIDELNRTNPSWIIDVMANDPRLPAGINKLTWHVSNPSEPYADVNGNPRPYVACETSEYQDSKTGNYVLLVRNGRPCDDVLTAWADYGGHEFVYVIH